VYAIRPWQRWSVVLAVFFSPSDATSAVAPILKRTSAKRKAEQWPNCGMIEPEWVPDRGTEKAKLTPFVGEISMITD
jgi:hypothetical protein